MSIILLLVRLLLVGVFLLSGVAKLADRTGSRQAMVDFGLPGRLAAPFGILLPLVELVVAGALLFVNSARWGALLAIALLLLFVAGITVNLAKGRRPDCHCFGQIGSEPIGQRTILRNIILASLAALMVWLGPGFNVLSWLSTIPLIQVVGLTAVLLILMLLIAEGWLSIHLMRQNGRLLLRMEALEEQCLSGEKTLVKGNPRPENRRNVRNGLSIGAVAPPFSLPDLSGTTVTLEELQAEGRTVLLVFSDPKCGPCMNLMPRIAEWQKRHSGELSLVVVSRGGLEVNHVSALKHGLTNILIQSDREVASAYEAHGTPSAVLVLPDRRIGSRLASGIDGVSELMEQVTRKTELHSPTSMR